MAKKAEQETPKKGSKEMIEVYIPIDRSKEKGDKYYCSVNGVAMLIPMGERVKVPAPFAYAVMNAQREADLIRNKTR